MSSTQHSRPRHQAAGAQPQNALFAGSDDGGEHWAVIAIQIEACKLNAVDPQAWLTETTTKLAAGHSYLRRDDPMPWNYTLSVGEKVAYQFKALAVISLGSYWAIAAMQERLVKHGCGCGPYRQDGRRLRLKRP